MSEMTCPSRKKGPWVGKPGERAHDLWDDHWTLRCSHSSQGRRMLGERRGQANVRGQEGEAAAVGASQTQWDKEKMYSAPMKGLARQNRLARRGVHQRAKRS